MIKKLLCIALLAYGASASAQCTPDPSIVTGPYGVWPDTLENFSNGMIGVFYSDTLNMLIPTNAGDINPAYNGITLDSVKVNSLTGLPPGLSISCNSQTNAPCSYLAGHLGCGLIEGMPTQTGTFPIIINVTAYLSLFGIAQPIPQAFTGYSITILDNNVGVSNMEPSGMNRLQNIPNPFNNRTSIEFTLSAATTAKIRVFNLVGEELWKETIPAKAGINKVPFDAGRLESGVYLFSVQAGNYYHTGRMVVNR